MDKENINSTNIQAIRNSKIKTLFDLNMQNVNVSGQLTRNAKQNTFKVAEPLVSIDNFESIYYKQMSPILTNNSNYQLKSRFIQLGNSLKDKKLFSKPKSTLQRGKICNSDSVKNLLKLKPSFEIVSKNKQELKAEQHYCRFLGCSDTLSSSENMSQKLGQNEESVTRRGRRDRHKIKPIGVKEIIKYS